jgi:hypothetical protein
MKSRVQHAIETSSREAFCYWKCFLKVVQIIYSVRLFFRFALLSRNCTKDDNESILLLYLIEYKTATFKCIFF